jgi:hypothetical protein
MSRERELLQRWVSRHSDVAEYHTVKEETETFLNQPEQNLREDLREDLREGLTREEISYGFRINNADLDAESYWAGVKYAEKMHGIGGEPLSNEQRSVLEAIKEINQKLKDE